MAGPNAVTAFGTAASSVPGTVLHGLAAGVVGIAPTPSGEGYWLVAADAGVFSFGDAPFEGSDGGTPRDAPEVGIAGRPGGYWIASGPDLRASMIPAIASTLKVDILATLLSEAQAQGRDLSPTEQSLAVPMIEDSLDSAADTLWGELGPAAVGNLEREAGMTSIVPVTNGIWGSTTTTAMDRLDMMRLLVEPNSVLTDSSRSYVLDLMENITPSLDWGATGGVPRGVAVALKNGFAIIDGWQINTEGWVSGDGRNYLIGVLTNGNASEDYGSRPLMPSRPLPGRTWPADDPIRAMAVAPARRRGAPRSISGKGGASCRRS